VYSPAAVAFSGPTSVPRVAPGAIPSIVSDSFRVPVPFEIDSAASKVPDCSPVFVTETGMETASPTEALAGPPRLTFENAAGSGVAVSVAVSPSAAASEDRSDPFPSASPKMPPQPASAAAAPRLPAARKVRRCMGGGRSGGWSRLA
jgi:hypothetical protein